MKSLHIHLSVHDLDQSMALYSTLFGAKPTFNGPKTSSNGENPFTRRQSALSSCG